MKKLVLIVCIASALLLSGCSKEKVLPEEEIEFNFFGLSMCKEGILNVMGDVLTITDYNSGVTVPLCDKTNCEHERYSTSNTDSQCKAAFEGGVCNAFLYKDNLYVFVGDALHTSVYMADSTGGERRKIAEADYECRYSRSVFHKGILYFIGQRHEYTNDEGVKQEREVFISSFDVNKQQFKILKEPDGAPELKLLNLAGGELFYLRTLYMENGEYVSMINSIKDAEIIVECKALNLETGEERSFVDRAIDDVIVTDNGNIYYRTNENGKYSYWKKDVNGEETFLFTDDKMYAIKPIIDGEWSLMPSEQTDFQRKLSVSTVYGDLLLITDENGKFGLITVENYLNDVEEILYLDIEGLDYVM